ncbi:ABC transporter permease [Pseudovibrio sp. Tun.PSC04-5.I4]|uniref:ABC transporter permease n=1 Tax=Pseudovibrio sp. Tun.PSC04-5.I4 TaxID=1798213 RepID=UPI00088545A3|nr:ABC transporter permease [Pseudovibrio sp. Tun.PSC04-5.I4]SDQ96820.1 peptide/nickel transport system permease protein [Pseudovibrio sp. Tun.PSC04-5.I4]
MGLLRFMAQRAAATLLLLIGISIVSFAIIQAVPGDYVDIWMSKTTAQTGLSRMELEPQAVILRSQLGLDQPVVVQYWRWISGIVTAGDFGQSFFFTKPVTEVIALRLPRTLALAFTALVLAQVIGGSLGVYAAMNQYKLGDTLSTVVAFIGIVIPKFVISLVILYYLAYVWHSPYIGALQSPAFILQDHWNLAKLWDFLKHVWPILLISIWAGQAYTLRMMRGNLLDVMKAQYIETARAKGLSRRRIILVHAIPNALHPVIMNLGSRFEYMIKGEIEIAIVLGVPTIGPLILSSVAERDMYVVAAIFMLVAMIMVIGNLVADLLLAVVDPRVRQAAMEGN